MQEILSVIQESLVKFCGLARDALEVIYGLLSGPTNELRTVIDDKITDAVCSGLVDIIGEIERKYNITATQQAVTFSYGGWDLKLVFYFGTLMKSTKHVCKATLSGPVGDADFSGTLDLKLKGSSNRPAVTGSVDCSGDDWRIRGNIDPLMVSGDRILTLWGNVGETQLLMELPVLYSYNELDLSLRDIPALSPVLSNIPFLIPGTTLSLDAGLDLKYNFPVAGGILINEVEPNPEGEDRDAEWAEVINLTGSEADLSGWSLVTSKGRTYVFPEDTVLCPGGRTVAEFEGIFLLNSSETLVLKDCDGNMIDSVGPFSDGYNDSRTYQRGIDGMTEWGMYEGTKGERNSGAFFSLNGKLASTAYSVLGNAAGKALSELGGKVTTEDGLAQLIGLTVRYTVDNIIDTCASFLVEASAYVEAEVTDPSSSLKMAGVRIHLTADEDLARDFLKSVAGAIAEMVLGIDDPYNIDLGKAVPEDVLLGVSVYAGAGLPAVLDPGGDSDVTLGFDVSVSVSALSKAFGHDIGRTKIKAGVVATNLPFAAIPSAISADKGMSHDLWAFRITVIR